MTDIRKKAQAMLNDARDAHVNPDDYLVGYTALCRAIEQHEAFRQAVSDAVETYKADNPFTYNAFLLDRFIIPKPKADPLVEVLLDMELSSDKEEGQHDAKWLRIKLDALGFEIREKGQ